MAITAAEGVISTPEEILAATIADCPRWQAMCRAADAEGAMQSIYFDALPPPPNDEDAYSCEQLEALRPYVMVYSDEDTGVSFNHSATTLGFNFRGSGRIKATIEQTVDPEVAHDPQEVFRRFKNDVGVLLQEMMARAGSAGFLAMRNVTAQGPLRAHEDLIQDEGDFVVYHLTLEWGR